MTEPDWLTCTGTPGAMLRWLDERVDHSTASGMRRKLRLFACAGMRRLLTRLDEGLTKRSRRSYLQMIDLAERVADGAASRTKIKPLRDRLSGYPLSHLSASENSNLFYMLLAFGFTNGWDDANRILNGGYWIACDGREPVDDYLAAMCILGRDLFGNPFRPLAPKRFPPHLVGLANAAYAALPERSADLLILIDALEEANEEVAAEHLRLEGHVKGCHVLDWLMGRPGLPL